MALKDFHDDDDPQADEQEEEEDLPKVGNLRYIMATEHILQIGDIEAPLALEDTSKDLVSGRGVVVAQHRAE